jgi:membrane protease YdiL (CAAX protease family)
MIVSAFVQDIGTFGFLQTYIEKQVHRSIAAVIVAISFFIAHFQYGLAYATLFYIAGFFLFAFLRYKTRSLYATNVLHLSFLLLV